MAKIRDRHDARQHIVDTANANSAKVYATGIPYTMRHLQRCVAIVRRRQLVSNTVLEMAGFNGGTRRTGARFALGTRLSERRGEQASDWLRRQVLKRQRADRKKDTAGAARHVSTKGQVRA